MRVACFVVNYHADEHVARFRESLTRARARTPECEVALHCIDNSQRSHADAESFRLAEEGAAPWVRVHWNGRNEGYFGPLPRAQALVEPGTDCVIYCNPDILLEEDFLEVLVGLGGAADILAPSLIAVDGGFEENPLYEHRLPVTKVRRVRAIFASQWGFNLYQLAHKLMDRRRNRSRAARAIYAGHGAIFVFMNVAFFQRLPPYPCFLYGEELFVAEEARMEGVEWRYEPTLRARDLAHASVSQVTSAALRAYELECLDFLLSRYYGAEARAS